MTSLRKAAVAIALTMGVDIAADSPGFGWCDYMRPAVQGQRFTRVKRRKQPTVEKRRKANRAARKARKRP